VTHEIDNKIAHMDRPALRHLMFANAADLDAWVSASGAEVTEKANIDGHNFVGCVAPEGAPDAGVTIATMDESASGSEVVAQVALTAVEVSRAQYKGCGFRGKSPLDYVT